MQRDTLAAKALVDNNQSCVEDSQQNERQYKHKHVVERVEIDQLVDVALTELCSYQIVHHLYRACELRTLKM